METSTLTKRYAGAVLAPSGRKEAAAAIKQALETVFRDGTVQRDRVRMRMSRGSGCPPCVEAIMLEYNRHRYLSLATFRLNGSEVRTPVWFAPAGESLYVFTTRESGKVKRLRRSGRARIVPCDVRGRVLGAWQEASARIVTEDRTIGLAHEALQAKYGWQMWLTDLFSRLAGRIQNRLWLEITLMESF